MGNSVASKRTTSRSKQALIEARRKRDAGREIPGPSTDPATNLFLADIAMRAGSYILRDVVERRILGRKFDKQTAADIVANQTLGQHLWRVGTAKLATRSVPGALVVSGGLAAKVLFDRAKRKREARRAGEAKLLDQAGDSDS